MSDTPKPWLVPESPWKSESAFWNWIRGVLRKGWSKHPVKHLYIQSKRKRAVNTNPKSASRFPEVWAIDCELCGKTCKMGDVEVDHKTMAGSLTALEHIKDYAERLFLVDFDSIRVLCKPCHKIVSYAQSEGVSFEEAQLQKKVIEICKQEKQIVIDFCQQNGHTSGSVSNASKRKKVVEQILREGTSG
jgi:hypothetical protein